MTVTTLIRLGTFRDALMSGALVLALLVGSVPSSVFAQEVDTLVTDCADGEEFSEEVGECMPSETFVTEVVDEGPSESDFCVIVSDPVTQEGGDAAVVLSEISSYWTALIAQAFWIWGENPAANQGETTTETFTRTFTLSTIPSSAELKVAADDGYIATLNGHSIGEDNGYDQVNFTTEGQDTYSVSTEDFIVGENTLTVQATNIAWEEASSNPGGLLFRLSLEGASCDSGDGDDDGEDPGTLVIEKNVNGTDEEEVNFTFSVDPEEGEAFPLVVSTNGRFGRSEEELPEGWYTVSEIVPDGWTLNSWSCDDEDYYQASEEGQVGSETVYLDSGETLTCTFTNTKDEVMDAPDDDTDGHTGDHVRSSSNSGQVLGASTECSPLLTQYLGKNHVNPADEVTKLQNFLNTSEGANIPVTGSFDAATEQAVRVFQVRYWEEVLQPWFAFPQYGVLDSDDSTGVVYKTTQWKINNLFCPGSQAVPMLP